MIITSEHLEDGAVLPDFLNHEHPSYIPNIENISDSIYNGRRTGMPSAVHVRLNGQIHKTRSGVHLFSWLERGGVIVAAPEQPAAVEEVQANAN